MQSGAGTPLEELSSRRQKERKAVVEMAEAKATDRRGEFKMKRTRGGRAGGWERQRRRRCANNKITVPATVLEGVRVGADAFGLPTNGQSDQNTRNKCLSRPVSAVLVVKIPTRPVPSFRRVQRPIYDKPNQRLRKTNQRDRHTHTRTHRPLTRQCTCFLSAMYKD